ncbi:FtsW/RodA/SpoVE family cell cycle protein [Sphingomonas colocasiae]|uniref:Probable peptidoglycan glycosyltransferase FtsW n=1 Tax=Sphingomonas colocasiae TaxID=1848973 RepID=A0ABS7PX92_9SPHN|nr:putative peptidoglycan glycosyltransferase FtsW [Sphingomonas colocasiae]MBY8825980.1 putative lipid II flippase FtsW [Sphingomonas colocasiae]
MTGPVVPRSKAVVSRQNTRDKHPQLGLWFWEIDRVLLLLVTLLISIGIIAVAAASPAAAERYSEGTVRFDQYHYLYRQLVWVVLSVPVMLIISTMPKERARRMALVLACIFLFCLALVPILGSEVNGAKRWIGSGFAKFQPSEFLKPCFTVGMAWLLSLKVQDRTLPVVPLSALLMGVIAVLLMKQPDFGQTVIFGTVWLALLLLSGVSLRIMGWLFGAGVAGVIGAYLFYDTATRRINDFIFQTGDTYQTDMAHATLTAGGLLGTGPGGGEMKFRLPEAHTDYIFSVIGEEFGLIACLGIALLYVAIVVRVFVKLLDEEDQFQLLAAAGLTTQFGVQAMINMAVNTQLAPSKGMTLPFISYGGSSMLALSLGFGLLLAFTRRNPYLVRSPYVFKWSGK